MPFDTEPCLHEMRRLVDADTPHDKAAILKGADQPFRLELAHRLAHGRATEPKTLGDVVERHFLAGMQTLREQHALELALYAGKRVGLVGQNQSERQVALQPLG